MEKTLITGLNVKEFLEKERIYNIFSQNKEFSS